MEGRVILGNFQGYLCFENIHKDAWDEPKIIFEKPGLFGEKRIELTDWQISELTENMIKFIEAMEKNKKQEAKSLEEEKKELLRLAKKFTADN